MKKKSSFLRWYLRDLLQQYKRKKDLHKVLSRNPTVTIEEDVQILNRKSLFLGEHIYISKGAILHCGGGEWCGHGGKISIGDHAYIAPYVVLFGAGEIEIQRRCQIGPRVFITSLSPDKKILEDESLLDMKVPPHAFAKVVIEEGVFLGAGTIVLMGITVGRGSIIPPGSLIEKDIPPYSLVVSERRSKVISRDSSLFRPR
jgi:acetyltransferase-like isoleucine patch superfamily enzyme